MKRIGTVLPAPASVLAAGALLAALFVASPAQAGNITLCNNFATQLEYAIVENNWGFLSNRDWRVRGWYVIDPGRCNTAVNEEQNRTRKEVYLSIRRRTKAGPVLLDYGVDERRNHLDSGSEATDVAFCVKDAVMNRKTKELSGQQSCPNGWYLQIFNVWAFASAKTDFTLQLKE